MLASRADREHAVDRLTTAFAEGRLDRDEFDRRVGQALRARTYADLARPLDDLPSPEIRRAPSPRPPLAERVWAVLYSCLSCCTAQRPSGHTAED
ncbi:MAG: DUF1707 domain-containing protein [Streptosporangiales bacterium]|nr:DUF1707 domain-containing protein [Streptosporangiales bacterium]